MRNYKSLDAYKYFIDGWVLEASWKLYGDIVLMTGRVKHSYAASLTPLRPWVAIRKNGIVEYGHCTCMAGLAETCSHIAAMLYWLETAVRIRRDATCTSKPNVWLPPSMPAACHQVPYLTMEELEQTASQRKKVESSKWKEMLADQTPTEQDLAELFSDLSQDENRKPAILSLTAEYSERFATPSDYLPPLLQGLYEPEFLDLNYIELLEKVENVCREPVSEEQVSRLEELTRGQAKNRQWFKYRAGRITASQLHQVCHTNPHQPSLSLVRRVCYPESYSFTTAATLYGSNHEQEAIQAYKSRMSGHSGLNIKTCGLFVDLEAPYLGASPDALVHCTCCGLGVVEVKCPWSARDSESLEEVAEQQKDFCLRKLTTGSLQLSTDHPYYLQCQLQLHITRRAYCDFVVWHSAGLHVERIHPVDQHLNLVKAAQFFRLCILPELAGKWYTRSHTLLPANELEDEDDPGTWCYCQESKGGDMVGCDNKNCAIKWFHVSCLQMAAVPSGKWFCPTCHPTQGVQKAKKPLNIA